MRSWQPGCAAAHHGSSEKYVHISPNGWNSRLDAIQAAILSIKLKRLDEWNSCRRQAAEQYRQALEGLPLELPVEPDYARHVYHLYVVRTEKREKLRKSSAGEG
jgi:dTDP-4-amino-4,6-dideoxygalactose transaminase